MTCSGGVSVSKQIAKRGFASPSYFTPVRYARFSPLSVVTNGKRICCAFATSPESSPINCMAVGDARMDLYDFFFSKFASQSNRPDGFCGVGVFPTRLSQDFCPALCSKSNVNAPASESRGIESVPPKAQGWRSEPARRGTTNLGQRTKKSSTPTGLHRRFREMLQLLQS